MCSQTEREMEEYLKRCERVATKAWRVMEEDMETISSKKRKFHSELQKEDYCGGMDPTVENSASPAASTISGGSYKPEEHSPNVTKKELSDLKKVDLQPEDFETEVSTSINRVFRDATPTSELYGDSEQVPLQSISTSEKKISSPPAITRRKTVEKPPSAAELEEFFAAAEKYEQKRFIEKYNYDIVKDVPLEGRYQWVRLHP